MKSDRFEDTLKGMMYTPGRDDPNYYQQESDTAHGDLRDKTVPMPLLTEHGPWWLRAIRRLRKFLQRKVTPMKLFKIKTVQKDPETGEVFTNVWTQDFKDAMTAIAEVQDMVGLDAKIEVECISGEEGA